VISGGDVASAGRDSDHCGGVGDTAGGSWLAARFVVDGFPRNGPNRAAWTAAGGRPAAVLELVCAPDVLRSRLLRRGQGRADDTAAVVERRLALAAAEGGGIAAYYERQGLLSRLDGARTVGEVLDAAVVALDGVDGW